MHTAVIQGAMDKPGNLWYVRISNLDIGTGIEAVDAKSGHGLIVSRITNATFVVAFPAREAPPQTDEGLCAAWRVYDFAVYGYSKSVSLRALANKIAAFLEQGDENIFCAGE